jgi:hypothetical protein
MPKRAVSCATPERADRQRPAVARRLPPDPALTETAGAGLVLDRSFVLAANVAPVSTSLSWTDLVALPEVRAAAWAGLRYGSDTWRRPTGQGGVAVAHTRA